jgi:hypothetical protein
MVPDHQNNKTWKQGKDNRKEAVGKEARIFFKNGNNLNDGTVKRERDHRFFSVGIESTTFLFRFEINKNISPIIILL